MAWLCLEFCGENSTVTQTYLDDLSHHVDVMTAVSFEKYTLGPNAELVHSDVTDVTSSLQAMGIRETWPMLSSYPHPPEFIEWMRYAFDHVDEFTAQCVAEAQLYNYTGYNLDWEPTDDVQESDGAAYAEFIDSFAKGLHAAGLKLQVDVATWSPIWDYDAIAATEADYVISMGTYTSTDTSFTNQLNLAVEAFGDRTGVGLEMVNASTGERMPLEEVAWRFQQIQGSGAKEVDVWRFPLPPGWWPLMRAFVESP